MPMVTRQTRNAAANSSHGQNHEIIPVPTIIEEKKEDAVDPFPRMGVIAAIVRILQKVKACL